MKTLDASILTELAKQQASEPLIIVGVQWVDKDAFVLYADKKIEGIHGKILSIGAIDQKLSVSTINNSSVEIVLNDTENKVRELYNKHDLHKRPCFVYQYFGNLPINQRFVLFKGLTNSPIIWSESERSISFTAISEVEDKEVGFSPEEADYDFISLDAVGKAWPLAFGDVLHVPATKIRSTPTGTLRTKFSIVDPGLFYKLDVLINAYFMEIFIYNYYKTIAGRIESTIVTVQTEIARHVRTINEIFFGAPTTNVEKLTAAYCHVIGLEDAYIRGLFDLEQKLDFKKKDYEKKKQGLIDWGKLTPKEHREEIKAIRDELKIRKKENKEIILAKKVVEEAIKQLDYELDVQREAFQKQTEAFNNILQLYNSYLEVLNEICFQRKSEVDTLLIENGENFPQGVPIDLLINGLRVRGVFAGEVFTIHTVIPKYQNVPLGPRETIVNDCGEKDYDASIGAFWVKDEAFDLKNMWALVQDRHDDYHIIYIEEQEGKRCYFSLIIPVQDHSGSGGTRQPMDLFSSQVQFPLFNHPLSNVPNASAVPQWNLPSGLVQTIDFANYNAYNAGFIDYINKTLTENDAFPLDSEEFFYFSMLERMLVADRAEDFLFFHLPKHRDIFLLIGLDIKKIVEVSAVPTRNWLRKNIDVHEVPEEMLWEATPGSTVTDFNNPYEVYIANILPSTVKSVMAYRKNELGETYLDVIPPNYYSLNEAEDLGTGLVVTSLRFKTPLKSIQGEEWEDTVYVSMASSVGPNVVETLKHIIETYTDKEWDVTTFDAIETLFGDKYPANFAIFDRPNVLKFLSDIAMQARCQLILGGDDKFYLHYISKEPTSLRTLTNTDIETGTVNLTYNATEDLITKLVALWREDYLPTTKEKEIVLRHNINKYGLHEQRINFYIYNIPELVLKSATFWLIRRANTWKYVSFNVFTKQLDMELMDCITLNINQLPSSKAIIEGLNYNSDSKDLAMALWLPIKAGQETQYPFAWPADSNITFPLPDDDAGNSKHRLIKIPEGQ